MHRDNKVIVWPKKKIRSASPLQVKSKQMNIYSITIIVIVIVIIIILSLPVVSQTSIAYEFVFFSVMISKIKVKTWSMWHLLLQFSHAGKKTRKDDDD